MNARWRGSRLIGDVDDAMQDVFLECFRDEGALTRAEALLRQTARRHQVRAEENGPEALRRLDLLRFRFEEGLPIRDIARR